MELLTSVQDEKWADSYTKHRQVNQQGAPLWIFMSLDACPFQLIYSFNLLSSKLTVVANGRRYRPVLGDSNENKPMVGAEEEEVAKMGCPSLGEHTQMEVVIEESYEFKVSSPPGTTDHVIVGFPPR